MLNRLLKKSKFLERHKKRLRLLARVDPFFETEIYEIAKKTMGIDMGVKSGGGIIELQSAESSDSFNSDAIFSERDE